MNKVLIFVYAFIWMNTAFGQQRNLFTAGDYVRALKHATDVMVNDVTSPVAAARYYSYINLSAIETVALFDHQQPRFAGVVKGLDIIAVPDTLINKSESQLVVILALYEAANRLLPSGYLLHKNIDSLKLVAKKESSHYKK